MSSAAQKCGWAAVPTAPDVPPAAQRWTHTHTHTTHNTRTLYLALLSLQHTLFTPVIHAASAALFIAYPFIAASDLYLCDLYCS